MTLTIVSAVHRLFSALSLGTSHICAEPRRLNRRNASWIACLALLAALGAAPLAAQTAYFSGAQTTLGSGFNFPTDVAVDASGNIYVADTQNWAVKEILASSGYTTTVTLGSGFRQPFAVAVDASGNVFVADSFHHQVKEMLAVNGSIPAAPTINVIGGYFFFPIGLALDASANVYVTDGNNVDEIPAAGGYATAVTLSSSFSQPTGVAVDAAGNVFVADSTANTVSKIVAVNGSIPASPSILTLASGYNTPWGLAVDASGNVFVGDTGNNAVKELLASGGYAVQNELGSGFSTPEGVATDANGNLYVADGGHNAVEKLSLPVVNFGAENTGARSPAISLLFRFNTGGNISAPAVLTAGAANKDFTDAGSGSCTTNGTSYNYNAGDSCTVDVTFTPQFAGARYGAVVLKDGSGNTMAAANLQGAGVGPQISFPPGTAGAIGSGLNNPLDVALDGSGNVYVADSGDGIVYKETLSGSSYAQSAIVTGLSSPDGIAVDGRGNLYVADGGDGLVYKETLTAGGYVQSTIASGLLNAIAVAVDGGGNVYVVDEAGTIYKETLSAGGYTQTSVLSGLSQPVGVAVDDSGNLYITLYGKPTVLKETLVGGRYIQSTLGSGLAYPQGLTIDGVGNVYIADVGAGAVYEETPSSGSYIQSTVIANYLQGMDPAGVALDGLGNVYIAGYNDTSVLKLDLADAPSLSFATTVYGLTSTDSPQMVTVQNIGNAPLSFPVPSTGSNPSIATSFILDSSGASACPLVAAGASAAGMLAAGASCRLSINFVPAGVGALSGTLLLTDNHLNAPAPGYATQSIALSGAGTQAAQVISATLPSAVTYGVGPIPLSATGGASGNPVTFIVISGPATISGGDLIITGAGTVVVEVDQAGNANYAPASQQLIIIVSKGPQTISFPLPVPVLYGQGPIPLSASGGASGNAVTFSVVSGPGTISGSTLTVTGVGTVVVAANQAGNANYSAASVVQQSITVSQATPVVDIVSSANPVLTENAVTLQATVLSAIGTPTGSVTFMDGAATLGSGTITGGVATLTTSSLAAGSHNITAVYGGDANFTALTSGTLTQIVEDFSLNLSASGGNAQTISAGQTATFMFTVGPSSGTTFPTAVSFTIDGLPAGATADFTPSSLMAGSPSSTVTLNIHAPQTANLLPEQRPGKTIPPVLWGVLLLPFAIRLRHAGKRLGGKLPVLALLAFGCAMIAGVSGCGGSSSSPKTYTITVTAISGSLSHSTTVTLTVD